MSEFINTVDILGDDAVCDGIIMRTITEYADSYIIQVGDYALYNCYSLANVDFPNAVSIGLFAFYGCTAIKTVNLPSVESIGNYGFYNNTALESITVPLVTELGKSSFYGCNKLVSIDLPSVVSMDAQTFYNCSRLETVILRNEAMCALSNTNAFNNTPIASGSGYVYVPSALVETYQNGTNWSVYSAQIRAIEDYPAITGG
jgi:hypothetical protein